LNHLVIIYKYNTYTTITTAATTTTTTTTTTTITNGKNDNLYPEGSITFIK